MVSRDIIIRNQVGLHSKPATVFSQKACEYNCSVWVEKGTARANAKSLLNVLSLGVFNGMEIRIVTDGPDEKEALEGICALICNDFLE